MPDCGDHPGRFDGLKALFLNCTLKRSPELSHTGALFAVVQHILQRNGVSVEALRPVDYPVAFGMQPDMRDAGYDEDAWPGLFARVMEADILIIGTPIWLGEKSSVATQVIERLYSNSGQTNAKGQYIYYGKVGGCLVTGNEDGAKHCAMNLLFSLQQIGFLVPPQAFADWVGEAGPGPSYADPDSGGPENDFTQQTATFMAWNLMHMARMLRDAGGFPAYGNSRSAWSEGCRFDHPAGSNPPTG